MELVSVNTSALLNIKYGETTVSTGIFKTSVAGPVFVGSHNLDGDTQADLKNHGGKSKAVYGFSADHYSYWSKTLNRPDIKPGTFGENRTISGFD
jgi:MOSC domain-containing protein YiiM